MPLTRRRTLLCAAGLWAAPGARAQTHAGKVWRLGLLTLTAPLSPDVGSRAVTRALATLGYVEGRNLVVDVSHAGGDASQLDAAAAALVQRRPDVIMAVTVPASLAAKRATRDIPIVAWGTHGAVESGLVSNLRRPGGNVTGTETLAAELDAKRLQLFKLLVPRLERLAVVTDDIDQGVPQHLKYLQDAARSLGVRSVATIELGRPDNQDATLAEAARRPVDGLILITTNKTFNLHRRILAFALAQHLPSMCEFRPLAQAGCLVSYGPSFDEINERCAAQIDKILKGTPPGELPIEQPTRFELVINLKTAKALGIPVPQELLLRADAVIE
ncbi:MAG: hypothetical protein RIQ60_48 [Pseudomonadota bacterium]|jgi:putative ABC transport system substrate-binding protein